MKPRILFILTLPPPVHGASMVGQRIKESRIIGDAFRCDFVNLSMSRHLEEVGRRSFMKPIRFIAAYLNTFWKLLTRHYDLCYLSITCYGPAFLKDAPFVRLCKLFGRQVVIHQHNKGMSAYVDRKPYNRMLPKVYDGAKVILLSWRLYPDISRVVDKENVFICPNGVSCSDVKSAGEAGDAVPHLLFLSNLIESKGVLKLLDALAILKKAGLSFKCDIVGSETKEIDSDSLLAQIGARDLSRDVIYHGPKNGTEKDRFLDSSDVLVLPTYYDCFPLVLLEAMAHGLPVVTTEEGGIPDIVSDGVNGFICKRRDPVSLAECMRKLLIDKDLRNRMGQKGREIYLERFTQEIFEKRMAGILQSIIDSAPGRGKS